MEFIAASNNEGKLKEIRRILERQGHTVLSQKQAGITLEPEETGTTFAENARIKAKAICEISGKPTLADDSGLAVDCLDGAPGVYSARYCGHHGDDEANNDKLLADLSAVPQENRSAKFISCVCIYLPDGRSATWQGECAGWVGFERKGTNGFGYDPIFNVNAFDGRSYAQLSDTEKDIVSHRGMAMRAMEQNLADFMQQNGV